MFLFYFTFKFHFLTFFLYLFISFYNTDSPHIIFFVYVWPHKYLLLHHFPCFCLGAWARSYHCLQQNCYISYSGNCWDRRYEHILLFWKNKLKHNQNNKTYRLWTMLIDACICINTVSGGKKKQQQHSTLTIH